MSFKLLKLHSSSSSHKPHPLPPPPKKNHLFLLPLFLFVFLPLTASLYLISKGQISSLILYFINQIIPIFDTIQKIQWTAKTDLNFLTSCDCRNSWFYSSYTRIRISETKRWTSKSQSCCSFRLLNTQSPLPFEPFSSLTTDLANSSKNVTPSLSD